MLSFPMSRLTSKWNDLKMMPYFFPSNLNSLKHVRALTQEAGAVEYTDCTSALGQPSPQTSVLIITLNNMMVRLQ